jgi:ABC-type Zn uptake system ZnuABC Zn-binding protein ZnuA
VMIVPDRAFAAAASRDDLQLQVVGPDAPASAVGAAVAAVRSDSLGTVYSEPPVIDRPIAAVAARTHTRVLALDTLDGPPPAGEAPTTDYFNRMEDDLARLASGLDCQDSSNTP